jgi:hypothetical protein|tara:strand:- start:362 stop:1726 length:1365 start_codon:yes stop_codon:yes gene_type:complete
MSVTRTFTVTVVATGSGNKYFIDGVQQPTLELVEGGTFRFDVSDSSMGAHPFKFSTTSNGTHSGGSEYTTNVTTSGTTGQSGAYVQIEVASDAPTLYYYCQYHSGMGGQANTPNTDFWGAGNWSANLWGISEAFTSGWGVDAWNSGGSWGQANDEVVSLTGQSATISVGTPIAAAQQGWGRDQWGQEPWGESFDPVVKPTGLSASFSIGSVSVSAQIAVGWGQDGWGVENYGQSGLTVEISAPDAMSSVLGTGSAWNNGAWGEPQAWNTFVLTPADVVGLTGQAMTSAVPSQLDIPEQVQGLGITSSVGSITPGEFVVGLTGQVSTSSVGALTPADVVGLTGQAITVSDGADGVQIGSVEIILPSGVSATVSVGDIDPIPMVVGLTGSSATVSVGSLTPADVMGLTGVSATASVAGFGTASGFGIQSYSDVDTGSNSSYTDVATGSNITYSDVA